MDMRVVSHEVIWLWDSLIGGNKYCRERFVSGVIDPCEEGHLDKIAVMWVATGEVER